MSRLLLVAAAVAFAAVCAVPVHAGPLTFTADLTGLNEVPSNASPGTGFAIVTIDDIAHLMWVNVTFADLIGTTTASHIHGPTAAPGTGTAGVATTTPTFTGFPLGVSAGTYSHVFDMTLSSSYNPSFLTAHGGIAGAEAALFAAIEDGKAYLNVHSTAFPGGEIRGFLVPVPEPGTMLLLGSGVAALGLRRRRALRG